MKKEHLAFDRAYGHQLAGVDEAGCSPLAGPVVAGAVIFQKDPPQELIQAINDSKKLSQARREKAAIEIKKHAVCAVGSASAREIEEINIYHASVLAMERAVAALPVRPEMILADGNRKYKFDGIKYKSIIKGDEKSLSIAAASIIAKVHRDSMMTVLSSVYPEYDWPSNKGYPCNAHKNAIDSTGITVFHRRTWKAVRSRMMNTFKLGRFQMTHKRVGEAGATCDSCTRRIGKGSSLVVYGQSTKTGVCVDCLERAVSWQEELLTALIGDSNEDRTD